MRNKKERQAELDRISWIPSPNPRYQGMSPLEIAWALLQPTKKTTKAVK